MEDGKADIGETDNRQLGFYTEQIVILDPGNEVNQAYISCGCVCQPASVWSADKLSIFREDATINAKSLDIVLGL